MSGVRNSKKIITCKIFITCSISRVVMCVGIGQRSIGSVVKDLIPTVPWVDEMGVNAVEYQHSSSYQPDDTFQLLENHALMCLSLKSKTDWFRQDEEDNLKHLGERAQKVELHCGGHWRTRMRRIT